MSTPLLSATSWTGRHLHDALCEEPQLALLFFIYGVMLRKQVDGAMTEYPVSASDIAEVLSAKICFDTGLMRDDILLVQREGLRETVVSFRKAQKTGLWLEGSDEPIRIPLPNLLLIRTSTGKTPSYQVYAVKQRPETLDGELFHAPLPNVYSSGSICWGTVRHDQLETASLQADWDRLLGTRFGSHAVSGKSKSHPKDIREKWLSFSSRKRVYPKNDLISANKTLAQALKKG